MTHTMSRRDLLVATPVLALSTAALEAFQSPQSPPTSVHSQFPSHEPALAREMVAVSHGRLERVQKLLDRSPALANATWDWGFGDWETALGAASHTGRREIAGLLMANGARPDIFTFAMLGQLDVVRAYVEASPGIQGTKGPHGLSLMLHARLGKAPAESVVAYLEEVGGAEEDYATLPLADEAKAQYLGTYGHGGGTPADAAFEISETRSGRLGIRRLPDGDVRQLYHLGDHEFHPAGASAVRIRFDVADGSAGRLTIVDGVPVLTADRVV